VARGRARRTAQLPIIKDVVDLTVAIVVEAVADLAYGVLRADTLDAGGAAAQHAGGADARAAATARGARAANGAARQVVRGAVAVVIETVADLRHRADRTLALQGGLAGNALERARQADADAAEVLTARVLVGAARAAGAGHVVL